MKTILSLFVLWLVMWQGGEMQQAKFFNTKKEAIEYSKKLKALPEFFGKVIILEAKELKEKKK